MMEACFPRIVLAEFNTHRWFSRNSASSRAIPVAKMIRMVQDNPYIPTHWGKNQKGMQAEQEVDAQTALLAISDWNTARDYAVHVATHLLELGIHKQITNRLLEPFMFHTVIVTATEWDNYFHLRCHPAAHPDIRKVAELMRDALAASVPKEQNYGARWTKLWDWACRWTRAERCCARSASVAALVSLTLRMTVSETCKQTSTCAMRC